MLEKSKAYSGFAVSDIGKTKQFYGETLGLKINELDVGSATAAAGASSRRRSTSPDLREARPDAGELHDPQLPRGGRGGDR